MILRKPYAFLIKHFKLLHMIILGCICVVLLNLSDISTLFRTLQKSSTYLYAGATNYINKSVYLFLLISLALSVIVFYLFKKKNKPNKLYLFLIIYLMSTTISYIYIYHQLNLIVDNALSSDTIILVKDLSFLLTIPAYVFIIVCFIRGIGFNIKKFNFSKDLDDLKISEKDREEFEFTLGQNNYKYMRTIRRTIRELKYYILENKFAIILVSCALVVVLSITFAYYYNGYLQKIKQSESTSVDNITYTVKSAYITENDYNGNIVKKGYKYVVIDLSLYNSSTKEKSLSLEKIVLANGKLNYYPTLVMNGKFYDLGKPYEDKQIIMPSKEVNATLAFEIPKTTTTTDFTLKVQYNLDGAFKGFKAFYKNFDVNAKKIDDTEVVENHILNEEVSSDVVNKNKFSFTIKAYSIKDSFSSKYIRCSSINVCKLLSNVVTSNSVSSAYTNKTMLILDYDALVSNDANIYKTFNTYDKIFANYLTVVYKVEDTIKQEKAELIDSKDIDNKVFIAVDRNIVRADEIYLQFDFRNNNYIVNLK